MSDADTTYNGWTNRETWLVGLWLANEESSYERSREVVRNAIADRKGVTHVHEAAQALRTLVEDEYVTPEPSGLMADLFGTAMARVNWEEVAKSILNEW